MPEQRPAPSFRRTPLVLSRAAALDSGFDDHLLHRSVAQGDAVRIRPGDYLFGEAGEHREDRYLALVRAGAARLNPGSGAVVSHSSAAVLHGLPVWGMAIDRIHVTRPGSPGASSTGSLHPHRCQLTDPEVTTIDGVLVTTIARTVLDIARTAPLTQAIVVADAALHLELTTADELRGVLDIARRRRAAGRAVTVVGFADGRSESVGESRSRVLLAQLGLPEPDLQFRVFDDHGAFLGRADFSMEEMGTLAEYDGIGKYVRYLRPGETTAGAVIREKLREDAMRATGRQMVRWSTTDLARPGMILTRFGAAFARAGFPRWTPGPPRLPPSSFTGNA
jgi:hypothetical protein